MMVLLFFIVGLFFGSFYNVYIYRAPLDIDFIKGRSRCDNCETQLKTVDLIPIFSFLFLGGKCRYCGIKLSKRYVFSEIFVGIIFMLAYLQFGLTLETLLMISFWSMLFIVAVIDYDHMIIMDSSLIFFSVINLIILFFIKEGNLIENLYGGLTGFLSYFTIYISAKLIFRKEGFGFGDVLLLAAIGLLFNPWYAFLIAFLAFYVSAIIFLISAIAKKIRKKKNDFEFGKEIPFAPSICIAAFIISIYGEQITSLCYRYIFG